MFMVVVLHVFGHGGILSTVTPETPQYHVAWLLEIGAYCAVNTFAMITGFLMIDRPFKYSRILSIWIQVVFYTLSIGFMMQLFTSEPIGLKQWIKFLFPATFSVYWYYTAYFGMFFLIPFMNKMIHLMSRRDALRLGCTFIILFCILGRLTDPFKANDGYSLLWICIMYMCGACIKKFDFAACVKKRYLALGYISTVLLTWISRPLIGFATRFLLGREIGTGLLVSYVSPTVILMAIALLLFFAKVAMPRCINHCMAYLAPLSFAVYIIHEHPSLSNFIIKGKFQNFANYNVFFMAIMVILTAASIYIACTLIEIARIKLFQLCRINLLIGKIGQFIDTKIDKFIN